MTDDVDQRVAVEDSDDWKERFTGEEPRLSEVAQMYRELGFEVRIEPFQSCDDNECQECFKDSKLPISVVYVRKSG